MSLSSVPEWNSLGDLHRDPLSAVQGPQCCAQVLYVFGGVVGSDIK